MTVELRYDDAWHDITEDCRAREDIVITRGRRDWASRNDPDRCTLQVDNTGGKYSEFNPLSPLYGKIGRNTPLRVRIGDSAPYLHVPGFRGSYVATHDAAAWSDLDLRIELEPDTWRPAAPYALLSKWSSSDNQRSFMLRLNTEGRLSVYWSTIGTAATIVSRLSTAAIPETSGRLAVRATLQVNNGAGGHVVHFYTAPSIAGPWTQLGLSTTGAGTTVVHAGTQELEVGRANSGWRAFSDDGLLTADIYAAEVRNGIDGAVLANPVFTSQEPGQAPFADSVGRDWALLGGAAIVDPSVRFAGEVVAWPERWDITGNDDWVPIEAAGISRRLGQGSTPARSAMFRASTNPGQSNRTVAYWSCEDGDNSTSIGSSIGGQAMTIGLVPGFPIRDVDFAAYNDFRGSDAITEFHITTAWGYVPEASDTGELRVLSLLHVPDEGVASTVEILTVRTSGTAAEWGIELDANGSLRMRAWDRTGTSILTSGTFAPGGQSVEGRNLLFGIWLMQNGSAVDWQIFVFEEGQPFGYAWPGTLAGRTFGHATAVLLGKLGDLNGTAMGHVSVQNTNTGWIGGILFAGFQAHPAEGAGDRIARIANEDQIPLLVSGEARTELLGYQEPDTTQSLLAEAAEADLGMLGDARWFLGQHYRTRASMENQAPLALDYKAGHISPPFEPEPDDQATRNDITVERKGGSSARAILETGRLSVQDPPNGVGRYDDKADLSLSSDAQAEDQASWRLHLGTVHEQRYPSVTVNLVRNPQLVDQLLALQLGDRLTIDNLPPGRSPDGADLLVQGYVERIGAAGYAHEFTFNCTPGSPWQVAVADLDRADTAGSELAHGVNAGDTTLYVVTTVGEGDGARWTTDPAMFPFDVRAGGERITVQGITNGATDDFARSVTGGWGSTDTGQPWITSGGAAGDYSVDGFRGLLSLGSLTTRRAVLGGGLQLADVDLTAVVSTSALAAGNWIVPALLARYTDADNHYSAGVEFKTNTGSGYRVGVAIRKVLGGTSTFLAGVEVGTYSAGQAWRVRFQIKDGTLRAKLWPATNAEPPSWSTVTTDPAGLPAGTVGVDARLFSANTNTLPVTITVDGLAMPNPQRLSVTRSVNGVTKPQAAGEDVRLWQPAIVAL
ncbi:hypothetical protein [Prauserella flavalba]|uniref:hypothetical protein n=1 Tax=Prauserella flavalba TaxID=1477506 RepID=UPI0036E086B1